MHQASVDERSFAYNLNYSIDCVLNGLTLYLHTFEVPFSACTSLEYSKVFSAADLEGAYG